MAQDELSLNTSILQLLQQSSSINPDPTSAPTPTKRRRNAPGTPDPDAEVIALSPKSLLATNRFVCEICNKGFQRDQNLQLHRRGHNLPWKLKQRGSAEVKKKVYICPELDCVHHNPSRALGDLTGIKKHFCRKHGEKKYKCEKCTKGYAVESDYKAHAKVCGTREYRCDCGTLFSRKDSFITHRAFCDVLARENIAFQQIAGLANELLNGGTTVTNPRAAVNPPAGLDSMENLNSLGQNTSQLQQQQQPPLWPEQENSGFISPTEITDDNSNNNSNASAFLASSSSNNFPELSQSVQMNLFGTSSAALPQWALQDNSSLQLTAANNSTSAELPLGQRPGEDNAGYFSSNLLPFYPSSFMSSANYGQPTYVQDSSATGLLLKATQIGSTMSLPGYHAGSIGLTNASQLNNNLDLNSNIEDQALSFFGHQNQAGNINMNEYMVPVSSGTAASGNNIMGVQSLADPAGPDFFLENNHQSLNNVMLPPSGGGVYNVGQFQATNHAGTFNTNAFRDAQTRDFMGIGNETTRPYMQQEFSSMGLNMDLNHFDA